MSWRGTRLFTDMQRGVDAPRRHLLKGMFAAFALSLPVTIALNLVADVPDALIYALTGAVHAVATFIIAGRLDARDT